MVPDVVKPELWKCGMRFSRPPSEVAVIGFIVFDTECRIALPLCANSGRWLAASRRPIWGQKLPLT